ncbi:Chemotaxis response regulator protein-glutamate methylesterase CheB [Desulfurella amilsii]|uniref:Protein-glutamate methylesterase/protein-glutamine glutaminase n=1 Tax=Desulfurella amilsii TaxID=1562698 RepID=A0A1X4XXN4_9BACT|nr:chemotaxis response regulator protein-glutamate methylesterase [Desulfurella amilsii]OSS42288.1 Chemotaxis response regulator protein-glutamate methylesterase CheB [Desulfurella amilsii]
MVRVLIVDDSLISRKYLTRILEESGQIKVIDTASDGLEAIEKVKTLKPDVVTMDIEMPKLNGIEALKHIMLENPVPIIMVSTLTTEGASITLEALHLGAVDYIPKNDVLNFNKITKDARELLIAKIIAAKSSKIQKPKLVKPTLPKPTQIVTPQKITTKDIRLIAIATSTGGPVALEKIMSEFPKVNVPVLIVQHMPATFTPIFAKSLDRISSIPIKEAQDQEIAQNGKGYLAPGGLQMSIEDKNGTLTIKISDQPKTIYVPSADVLFSSCAETTKNRTLAIIMTGMGNDGYEGLLKLKKIGGTIIAQSKESCVVWGMPRKPTENNIVDYIGDLEEIPNIIKKIIG